MARRFGKRLVDAVVPRYFDTQSALSQATRIAFSTINDWANEKADPRPPSVERVVAAIKKVHDVDVDALELLRDGPAPGVESPRDAALAPLRNSTDPDVQEAVRRMTDPATAFHGVSAWTVDRWMRKVVLEIERVREERERPVEVKAASDARAAGIEADRLARAKKIQDEMEREKRAKKRGH